MKKIINFLRKIGLLQISSGDYITGEFDTRKDLKNEHKKTDEKDEKRGVGFIIFKIFVFVGLLLLLFTLIMLSFSFWFFISLVAWVLFMFYTNKALVAGSFVLKKFLMIFFVIMFINLIIVVSFSNTSEQTNTKVGGDSTYQKDVCAAKHLKRKANRDITLEIIDEKYNDKTKAVYTMDELSKLLFEAKTHIPDNGIYLSMQICQGDEPISFMPLSKMYFISKKKTGSGEGVHIDVFDQHMNMIHAGKYQIYSYYSNDGETWYTNNKLDFEVK